MDKQDWKEIRKEINGHLTDFKDGHTEIARLEAEKIIRGNSEAYTLLMGDNENYMGHQEILDELRHPDKFERLMREYLLLLDKKINSYG